MKWLILLLLSSTLMAGESGLYFDPERNGEGISVHRSGDTVVTFLFTYGALFCDGVIEPTVSPSLTPEDCDLSGQRYFFATDDIDEFDTAVSGALFITSGRNYPDGIIDEVGEAQAVGVYTLVRKGDGFLMAVDRFGSVLTEDDPLFERIFDFSTRLFIAD